ARRREARALLDVAKRNVVDRPGFFRVRPYDDSEEDQQLFDRADGAHEAVLRWLRDPREPLLFLSGLSGTGKSSLLYAYVLPRLRRDPAAGPPARDLVPRHSEQPPPAPRAVVVLRSYDDPIGALTAELRKLDALRRQPPETGDPRDLLRLAAERSGGRLLVVLDQFEGLLIAQESHAPRFEAFVALLKSLGRDPVPGVTVLITLRGDYLGFLEDLGLATITLNENLKIIQAFRPQDARAFLGRSGLPIEPDLLRKAVDQLAAVEQTEGLIRPITLNMLGLALSHRSPADVAELPNVEEILTDYCRSCISRPAIGPYAPAVLRPLISRVETIQPRTVAELARRTRLRPGVVRGVLLNLGNDGLVRRVDAKEDLWEVAHDFVAHLLAGLLRRFQTLKVGIPAAAAVALLVGLAIAFVPPAGPPPHIPPSPEPPPKPAPSPVFAILGPNDDPRAAIPWLWDNGATIKIHFLDGALPLREEVKRFASEWTAHANLTFEYVADRDAAAVRISLETNPGAFYSFLGAQARAAAPDQPTAVLGFTPDLSESERRRRTLFVFGHILGLISEHTNPNCQGVLRFKKPEVYDYYAKAYGW
ncbi:MAG TPA: hypothetical protein VF590_20085, partial [Isosphaeraceae bacterium]